MNKVLGASDGGLANWDKRRQKKAGQDLFHLMKER